MKPALDLLMVGVGGQGIVLASDVLAEAALTEGFDVKKSDALGMSQRGGSVVSHVRLGPQVHAPLVKKGEAHILLGFEKLEAARWAGHLRTGGVVIVNDQAIPPLSVSSGSEEYPSDETVLGLLRRRTQQVYLVPGPALAQESGNPRALNAVMLGFLSPFLESVRKETLLECLSRALPPNLVEANLAAFQKGRAAAAAAARRPLAFERCLSEPERSGGEESPRPRRLFGLRPQSDR